MKQIHITRSHNIVTFETVSIDNTENVFFTNEDPIEAHYNFVWQDVIAIPAALTSSDGTQIWPPPGNVRTLTFPSTTGPGGPPTPPQFTINDHRFALNPSGTPVSPDSNVDQCQRVNTIWDWTLQNTSKAPNQVHPFHIHINPFQILELNYTDANGKPARYTPQYPIWSDTVNIPAAIKVNGSVNPLVNGSVKIRQEFNDFTGTYVLYCHILAHEDRGMMQLVRTIPADADPAKACKLNGVEHH